ncbi:hypothetical protein [Desulfurivibrio alkaliphilus]|uniref:Major facilitator transporter n=1 Tax=Desulfurivibrio alkaliphilus (strain DSM 19089 / UNIQEM U267 / AHT2) TaxID=589865 RepID=D6Z2B1_DESAT|nr:hypothetical protein [Desulfurivibrio alkaliphilus]ADH85686.1 major facilitator transporter [Desulfurivibrio alkaliphilus AHT 2]
MNILLGTFIGLLLIYVIAYTDFVLSRKLKMQVAAINDQGRRDYSFQPLSWPLAAGLALGCWAVLGLLPRQALYLEYRILLTLLAWGVMAGLVYWFLKQRTNARLAQQALLLLLGFAVISGLLLAPLANLLNQMLPW